MIVGIEGAINLGFIIRLAYNFEVDELYLVDPRVDVSDDEVRRFAARGKEYIGSVRVVGSMDEAIEDMDLVACTSAIVPSRRDPLRQAIELRDFVDVARQYRSLALVFGRESTGLTRRELEKCNLYIHIRAGRRYPVLNLSHAVAVALYELYDLYSDDSSFEGVYMDRDILGRVMQKVSEIVGLLQVSGDRAEWILKSVERIIYTSKASSNDFMSLLFFMNRILSRIKRS